MLKIISRKPGRTSTGFVYQVKQPNGRIEHLEELDLLSETDGIEAIENFEEQNDKPLSPSKRQKILSEPIRLADGPHVNQRISVNFKGKWAAGTVIACTEDESSVPIFTIQYDDGWQLKDRLTLPWYPLKKRQSGRSGSRKR
jgi:hypothetical protein